MFSIALGSGSTRPLRHVRATPPTCHRRDDLLAPSIGKLQGSSESRLGGGGGEGPSDQHGNAFAAKHDMMMVVLACLPWKRHSRPEC